MKNKKIVIIGLVLIFSIKLTYAQYFKTNTGEISFFSKTPLKDIEAKSKSSMAVLKTSTNEIAVRITNTSFKFPNSLMEEHFNEKYIESSIYPISTFSGKINDKIDYQAIGEQTIQVVGKFNIHGVEQNKTIDGKLIIEKDAIKIKGSFKIKLEEFKITKPTIVFKEIADEIDIFVDLDLKPSK